MGVYCGSEPFGATTVPSGSGACKGQQASFRLTAIIVSHPRGTQLFAMDRVELFFAITAVIGFAMLAAALLSI